MLIWISALLWLVGLGTIVDWNLPVSLAEAAFLAYLVTIAASVALRALVITNNHMILTKKKISEVVIKIATWKQKLSEARLSRLLNLYEEVEQLAVLGVDDFAVTCNVAAKHFLVSLRTRFHGFSFLKRVHLLRS